MKAAVWLTVRLNAALGVFVKTADFVAEPAVVDDTETRADALPLCVTVLVLVPNGERDSEANAVFVTHAVLLREAVGDGV